MLIDTISPKESGFFTKLMLDYLYNEKAVQPLFNRFPSIENFKAQIEEKKQNYTDTDRQLFVTAILNQYSNKNTSKLTQANIEKLALKNTFTVTTGHQLNLFTGPVYYLYKILSVINLAEDLSKNYPENNFVPIFWMATEDHDFEEINYFKFRDKKIKWSSNQKGPVGRFNTDEINQLQKTIENAFGPSTKAKFLCDLFIKAYTEHNNLAEATFFLTNELFKDFGIVIVNGDDKLLKSNFNEIVKQELTNHVLYNNIIKTKEDHLQNYHVQVNPREINLFYIDSNLRERIVYENEKYHVLNTNLSFTESEIFNLIETSPEKFSPNAILRPVYQEKILPNLAYVGGGGELAYWLELKTSFEAFKITFPILVHRDSVMLVSEKLNSKINKLEITYTELFKANNELSNLLIHKYSNNLLDFSELKQQLKTQFEILNTIAIKTDKSFSNALNAQQKKQFKGLENLEKKLVRAEKKMLQDKIDRVFILKEEIFPNKNLQERTQNFSEFYIDTELNLIENIKKYINPLKVGFKIIQI
jgi:bacillithiol synthase